MKTVTGIRIVQGLSIDTILNELTYSGNNRRPRKEQETEPSNRRRIRLSKQPSCLKEQDLMLDSVRGRFVSPVIRN